METGLKLTREVLQASGISPEATDKLVDENYGREWHKVINTSTPGKKVGYKDILLVLTPDIDISATLI